MSSRPPEDGTDTDRELAAEADARADAEARAEAEADADANADANDEDRLPWLEPIDDDENDGPSPAKLIGAVLIGLLAIGLIVGGLFWYGNRAAQTGDPEVIAAPEGAYKVRPDKEGGMQVDDKGSTQVATSDGREETSSINKDARPQSPVGENVMAARPAPAPAAPAARPAQGGGAQQARLTGPQIQMGAFPSEAVANAEWTRLSQRHAFLRGLQHAVQVHRRGGTTFYRLRAAGTGAPDACRRLRAAGQPCMDVND